MKKNIILITSLLASLINLKAVKNLTIMSASESFNDITYNYMTEDTFYNDFYNVTSLSSINTNSTSNDLSFSMKTYFQNLFDYSPKNSHGSCGYVSFIQYLSYFDTFRNDDIIPTVYERSVGNVSSTNVALASSPGVLRQDYPSTNLYSFIQSNKSSDFQMYLMDIVNSSLQLQIDEYDCGIGMWDYYRILNALFPNNNVTFSYARVSDIGTNLKPTDANVINWFDTYVKGQLDLGNPVMLHIAKYDEENNKYDNYHSVVAYYYDDNGIHAHFGWDEGSEDTIIQSTYQITEAGVMNLDNIPLSHSNNYTINNVKYCGCGQHFHKFGYTISSSTHTKTCSDCNYSVTSSHTYDDHYCIYCGKYTSQHDYDRNYVWQSLTQHKASCSCGVITLQAHVVSSSDYSLNISGEIYKTCLLCGGRAKIGFIQNEINSPNLTLISENGSYILPNGVIVLADNDIENYMKGILIL